MERIQKLMKFLWPIQGLRTQWHTKRRVNFYKGFTVGVSALCTLSASLFMSGCFDSMESSADGSDAHFDKYAPLLVKEAKAMIENDTVLCLPDMHKSDRKSPIAPQKKSANQERRA